MVQETRKHYSSKQTVSNFLKRKITLEAKAIKEKNGAGISKEQNRLRKIKSVFLSKAEDSFDATLDLIEGSNSDLLTKEIERSWPKDSKSKETQDEKKREEDIRYFKQKIFEEFDETAQRVFSDIRVERMLKCIFRSRPYGEYLFDNNQAIYRLTIAKMLIDNTRKEFVSLLAPDFQNLFSNDLKNTSAIINRILRIVKHGINPIRGIQ